MSESLVDWNAWLQVASLSDVGMRRATNQDNMCVALASSMAQWQEKGHLFVVADGMGAHAAGELASKLAVDHIPHLYARLNEESPGKTLQKSMSGANSEIHRRGQANEEFHNMGTTCSSLVLLPGAAIVSHIGDSRVYRMRNNTLDQLTFDHSLVWEMKAAGQLSPEDEASNKIPKNVITRSLGPYAECRIDLEGPFPVRSGDTFLLCSDGLTGVITDQELGSIMANMTPDEAVRVLVDLSNLRGGPDNITVVIVKVLQPLFDAAGDVASPAKPAVKSANVSKMSLPMVAGVAVLVVSLLLIAWLVAVGNFLTLWLPGIAALGSTVFLIYQSLLSNVTPSASVADGKMYGRGPYVKVDCKSGDAFAEQLEKLLEELKEGAKQKRWQVDWERLEQFSREAKAAIDSGSSHQAVAHFGRAISFMMDQLRNQEFDPEDTVDM